MTTPLSPPNSRSVPFPVPLLSNTTGVYSYFRKSSCFHSELLPVEGLGKSTEAIFCCVTVGSVELRERE